MRIEGSCYCGAVSYALESRTPYPYMHCYCSICRKTAGAAFAINIMGEADTLEVTGSEQVSVFRAPASKTASHEGSTGLSPAKRNFCGQCGSFLWVADPRWAQWVYPFASSVDTKLPTPPERAHIMLEYAAPWVDKPNDDDDRCFDGYPAESIEQWHKRLGLYEE